MKLGQLKYSVAKEEGYVEIDWATMPTDVVGLDILQDWIVELHDIYDEQHGKVYKRKEQPNEY
jgi:hypothetical protein